MTDRHKFNRFNQRNAIRSLLKWDYLTRMDFYSDWGSRNAEWLIESGFADIVRGIDNRLMITYTDLALKEYKLG